MVMICLILLPSLLFLLGFFYILRNSKPRPSSSSTSQGEAREPKSAPATPTTTKDAAKTEADKAFATFDSDGDGYITTQELLDSLARIGISTSGKEVAGMIERLDSNGDGVVDADEFRELYDAFVGGGRVVDSDEEVGMKEAFDVFDCNGDGLICEEELSRMMRSLRMKEGFSPASCREMIRKVDLDGDGMVSFEEFKLMMK